jgi:hypothetical protein
MRPDKFNTWRINGRSMISGNIRRVCIQLMNVDLEYLHLFQRNKFRFWRSSSPLINSIKAKIGLNIAFKAYFSALVSHKLNTYLITILYARSERHA